MSTTKKTKKEVSFAKKFEQLETIVEKLENGDLSIDKSITQFEKGLALAAELKEVLEQTDNTIEELKKKYDE